jgi:hypothetical protein
MFDPVGFQAMPLACIPGAIMSFRDYRRQWLWMWAF